MRNRIFAHSPHILSSQYTGPMPRNDATPPPADPPKDPPADPPKDPPADPPKDPPKEPSDEFKGRLTDLETKNKELAKKLKEKEDAEKAAQEAKLKEEGKTNELLTAKEKELAELTGKHTTTSEQLKAYEEAATEQINKQLEGIKDEKKREEAKKLLEGMPVLDQYKKLPSILELVGSSSGGFGGPTPAGGGANATTKEQMESRLNELVTKAESGKELEHKEIQEQRELERKLDELTWATN